MNEISGDKNILIDNRASRLSGYFYSTTFALFGLGGVVTAVFSGSLSKLAVNSDFGHVLMVSMLVPSFTWVVQLVVSGLCLESQRRIYWRDLSWVCLWGSVALLPAAIANLFVPGTGLWISKANVIVSVLIMAIALFWRSRRHGISLVWPVSWCFTILLNIAIFMWCSRGWWNA